MCVSWISQSSSTRTDKQLEVLEPVKERKHPKLTERRSCVENYGKNCISVHQNQRQFSGQAKRVSQQQTQKQQERKARVTQSQDPD